MAEERPPSARAAPAPSVWGVVVAHNPPKQFAEVLRAARAQLAGLLVWENSPQGPTRQATAEVLADVLAGPSSEPVACPVILQDSGSNVGLSRPYNVAARIARSNAMDWLLLLDQDSVLAAGTVEQLVSIARALGSRFRVGSLSARNDEQIEVPFSPRRAMEILSISHDTREYRRGRMFHDGRVREVRSFTNSGTMLSISALEAVGGFDERLFLDAVDFRLAAVLRAAGYRMFETNDPLVRHRQGEPYALRFLWGSIRARSYPPERTFYIVRDTLRFARLSAHDQPGLVASVLVSVTTGTIGAMALLPERRARGQRLLEGVRGGLERLSS